MHFDNSIYHQHYCIASLIAIINNISFRRISRRKSFWVLHFFDFVQQSTVNRQQSTINRQQSIVDNQQFAFENRFSHLLLSIDLFLIALFLFIQLLRYNDDFFYVIDDAFFEFSRLSTVSRVFRIFAFFEIRVFRTRSNKNSLFHRSSLLILLFSLFVHNHLCHL